MFLRTKFASIKRDDSSDSGDSAEFLPRSFFAHLTPLAVTFTFLVIVAMLGLGAVIINDYRTVQTQSYSRSGAVYINSFLGKHVLTLLENDAAGDPIMMQWMGSSAETVPELLTRVWALDGRLLYSNFESGQERQSSEYLQQALSGEGGAELIGAGDMAAGFPMPVPFFRFLASIYDPNTGQPIAIAETFKDASEALRDRWYFERTVWAALVFASLGGLAMLALSFSQSAQIQARLDAERRVAKQNERLRRNAAQVQLDAVEANEQVLNLVAAELHDGPVQLLGLVSLMRGEDTPSELADGTTIDSLIDQVMAELRRMSAGLILPELDRLNAEEIVVLAVERHRKLTGREITLDAHLSGIQLDGYRRICLYRVIQEGLMNAIHHGSHAPFHVSVHAEDEALEIEIRNQTSEVVEVVPEPPTWHLGLHGMRRRLEVYGGSVALHNDSDEISLCAKLPLQAPPVGS